MSDLYHRHKQRRRKVAIMGSIVGLAVGVVTCLLYGIWFNFTTFAFAPGRPWPSHSQRARVRSCGRRMSPSLSSRAIESL